MGRKAGKISLAFYASVALSIAVFALAGFNVAHASKADDIQNDIEETQKKLDKAQAELQSENSRLYKNKSQIASTQSLIASLQSQIARLEGELGNLSDQADSNRTMLAEYIRQIYYGDSEDTLSGAVFSPDSLSDLSSGYDRMLDIKSKIIDALQTINETKSKVEQAKSELSDRKDDSADQLQDQKAEQSDILDDIQDTQDTIADLQKKFEELQSDLNKILGSNYDAKDIKDAVKYASDKTDVPQGFLVGVLKMETNLGANVGGCTYADVEDGAEKNYKKGKLSKKAWATFQYRRSLFEDICDDLDINYRKQKVSCNPSGYSGTGGAMGVAQFMPDTWNAYTDSVSSITGHDPASPWNLTDGIVAMALKLRKTSGVTSGKESAYKSAACSYLGTCYAPYINGILYWAKHYKDLI